MSSLTLIAANRNSGRIERESRFRHRKRFPLTTRFRKEKVRVTRQQLAEGIYDLDVHLDAVVKDHKQLIQILDQIQEHQHDNVRSEAISTIMDQLREFSSSHFQNEEEYILKVGFPGYQAHKEQHRQFREKNAALCIDVMNHKETAPQDIYNYLSDWEKSHFLDFDKELRTFREAKFNYA